VGAAEPEVVTAWEATERQAEFLAASELEVLFGGAAGGGKTDGLLVDSLGLSPLVEGKPAHIEKRAYQAIIFRKTFPDLKDIIDRSHEVFTDYDRRAEFDKQFHVWQFPSGARIEFGHLQRDIERFRYRGRAFQYIGWEELTLWPTMAPYLYLMSRLRTTDLTIPLYVRSTTNPDGPGFRWVMDRWRIPPSGKATRFAVQMKDVETSETFTSERRFIPSKVEDNPHIGKEYIANLLQMEDEDQKRLRRGLWVAPQIKGAYYTAEMGRARDDQRIAKVPYVRSVPVDTYWDLGLSKDSGTTAIWCGQYVAMQHRFLRCVENHSESLDWYVKWLLETGFAFGRHFLPHDAGVRRLGKNTIKSWKELLQELMPGHTFVLVPRIEDVSIGIQQAKARFDECCFDEEGCAEGIAALENYQREWDEDNQVFRNYPLHNWASNYADAFRQFGQGWKPVRSDSGPKIDPWTPLNPKMGY
jgi:hypothetical protein